MPMFDFMQDVGEKFDRERQRQLDEKRAAAEAAAARAEAEEAAEAAKAAQAFNQSMAENLAYHIKDLGLASDEVTVRFEAGAGFAGGHVTLTGSVPDAETRDKIVLAVGNMMGVAGVDDQLDFPPAPEPTFYTVKKGDTLSKISTEFYGKGRHYRTIFEANKPMLKDPNKIYPGQVLRIPEKPE